MTLDKARALVLCGLMLPAMIVMANDKDGVRDSAKDQARARARARDARKAQQRAMSDAKQTLERSMRQARDMNVIAIVTKMGDCMQKLKVEQKAKCGQLSTVLQPLSMQGAVLFNKGSKSFTYLPDQRIVVECDNDFEGLDEIAARAELAARNYELSFMTTAPDVAGRSTYCVVAEPRVAGIPARQFYLDQQTLYPLRFSTQATGGSWRISMDTQVVDFPKDMPQPDFNPVGVPRKVKFDPAQPLNRISNVRDRLGFEPVVPRNLPYGFQIQRAELRRNQDGQLAMLSLTDGLATARVYEFRCNQMQDGIWSQGSNTVLTEDGVMMVLVSDLRADVRKALLSSFAHRTPTAIAPPAGAHTVSFSVVKPPPVPSKEPGQPQPLFIIPDPEPAVITGKSGSTLSDTVSVGQANDVKGD